MSQFEFDQYDFELFDQAICEITRVKCQTMQVAWLNKHTWREFICVWLILKYCDYLLDSFTPNNLQAIIDNLKFIK